MDKIIGLFNSSIGKLIIYLLIIAVIIYLLSKEYEKAKYNGMSREEVVNAVSELYVGERRKEASRNSGSNFDNKPDLFDYYDTNFPPDVVLFGGVEKYLKQLGIDIEKYPELLSITAEVNSISYLGV